MVEFPNLGRGFGAHFDGHVRLSHAVTAIQTLATGFMNKLVVLERVKRSLQRLAVSKQRGEMNVTSVRIHF